jgi:putative ABC transport system substrate-binding protein
VRRSISELGFSTPGKKGAKVVRFLLCASISVLCPPAGAEQATKIPRIGFLIASSQSVNAPRYEAFVQGLRELRYEDGKNIVIE